MTRRHAELSITLIGILVGFIYNAKGTLIMLAFASVLMIPLFVLAVLLAYTEKPKGSRNMAKAIKLVVTDFLHDSIDSENVKQ